MNRILTLVSFALIIFLVQVLALANSSVESSDGFFDSASKSNLTSPKQFLFAHQEVIKAAPSHTERHNYSLESSIFEKEEEVQDKSNTVKKVVPVVDHFASLSILPGYKRNAPTNEAAVASMHQIDLSRSTKRHAFLEVFRI